MPASRLLPRALVAALLLLGAACGADGDPDAGVTTTSVPFESGEPVDGLRASVEQSRLFSLDRALALGLQNVGADQRDIVQIGLETPLFEPVALTDRSVVLPGRGREYTMPVPYGPPVCDGEPAPDDFTAVVVLADGTELRLDAPERNVGAIARMHERECAAAAVLDVVDLRFGDGWVQDGRSVRGELVLVQRQSSPPVAVEEMAGTVIFGLTVDADPPILTVDDQHRSATVPAVVSAERCDPHALIEAKKAFVFLAWVSVDGAEPVPVEIQPEGPARAALDALLATCLD